MQIVETNLQFSRAPSKRTRTGRIILHHTASADVSAATIHGWHQGQGWSGIGYHYVIQANGTIEKGRPEWAIGSHSGPNGNGDSIGVVLTGNFETGKPTAAQIESLVWLLKDYLQPKYGPLTVIGHKDVMATACPGKNFDVGRVRKLINSDDRKPVECKINIKGKEFTGYLLGGVSYFDEACKTPVKEVVQAIAPSISWDDKSKTVIIK